MMATDSGSWATARMDSFEPFLDALGDANLAFPVEQLDAAHLAHVHAHRVGGAAELIVQRRQCGSRFFDRFIILFAVRTGSVRQQQGFIVRSFLVDGDPHVLDHANNVVDLFGIDHFRQMVRHFRVGSSNPCPLPRAMSSFIWDCFQDSCRQSHAHSSTGNLTVYQGDCWLLQ